MAITADSQPGLIVSLTSSDGRVRLVMEDAEGMAQEWSVVRLFTWKEFDAKTWDDLNFTKDELADIGLNVVARLQALSKER